jgi:pantoate kinase
VYGPPAGTGHALPPGSTAFAPGHVTGIFLPRREAADPLAQGSLGAGVVLDLGSRACAWAGPAPPGGGTLTLLDRGRPVRWPITEDAIRRIPGTQDHHLRVELVHELPVSQGLSMSAAGSLAASLAVAREIRRPESEAVAAAHRADLELHGGLGGVASILGPGLEVRRAPGIPPHGVIERTSLKLGFFLATTGAPLPSPPLLSDPAFLQRVTRAAERSMGALPPPPVAWELALQVFERFTDELALAPPPLRRVIDELRYQRVRCAQAMLGNTLLVWAGDTEGEARAISTLRRAHLTPWRLHVGERGAFSRAGTPMGPGNG